MSESFAGYTAGDLNGQAASGAGLTGNWAGATDFKYQETGLSLGGVTSTGGSVSVNSGGNGAQRINTAFVSTLSTGQLFGSYLFTTTISTVARTAGAVLVGSATDSDSNASFVWAGNGYNGGTAIEGPNIRAEGTGSVAPFISLIGGQTYIMLFQFNGATGENSAWVLNQSQLANFSSSLDAATLNTAEFGEGSTNVAWKGSVDGTEAGPMSNLILLGFQSTDGNFSYTWDEFRISDASLSESLAVPESTTALLGAISALALFRRRRSA